MLNNDSILLLCELKSRLQANKPCNSEAIGLVLICIQLTSVTKKLPIVEVHIMTLQRAMIEVKNSIFPMLVPHQLTKLAWDFCCGEWLLNVWGAMSTISLFQCTLVDGYVGHKLICNMIPQQFWIQKYLML